MYSFVHFYQNRNFNNFFFLKTHTALFDFIQMLSRASWVSYFAHTHTHTHKCCNSDYCLYPCMCVCVCVYVCVCVCYEGIRFVTCSWVFIYFQGKHGKSGQWENWYKWCVQVSWWKQDFLLFNCIVWLSFSVCYVFPSYMVHPFVMLMCTSLESNAVLCLLL